MMGTTGVNDGSRCWECVGEEPDTLWLEREVKRMNRSCPEGGDYCII